MADRKPATKPAKRGLDTVSAGDRTTTSSVSLAGPVSRCSMRFWARTDSGLLAKLDCVVSAPDRKAREQTAAAARTTIQTATVRHGWRALARASRSGVLISDHPPTGLRRSRLRRRSVVDTSNGPNADRRASASKGPPSRARGPARAGDDPASPVALPCRPARSVQRGDPEHGVTRRDGLEVGHGRVPVDRYVRARAWHLLQVALDDRRTLAHRHLGQPACHRAAVPQRRPAPRRSHVLDPVA